MRILVVAEDEARRKTRIAALQRLELVVVGATGVARLAAEVRATTPDVLLVDGLDSAGVRQALERARRASERPLAAVLLLAEGMTWLRTPLPPDLQPAVVLASAGLDDRALARAVASLAADGSVDPEAVVAHALRLEPRALEVTSGQGSVRLTPSEATVLRALLDQPSSVVRVDEIARALYGHRLSDPRTRAAVHGHVSTLRRKLATIGAGDQVEAIRSVGYRLVELRERRASPPARPRPPGRT